MAKLYQELGNFELADNYFAQAAGYQDNSTLPERFLFANSHGNFYYVTKEYEKALVCFREASELAQTLSQPFQQAIAETNIGEIFVLSGQADSARYYLDKAGVLFGENVISSNPSLKFYMTGLRASLALLENNLPEAEKLLLQPYDTLSINPQYIYFHNKRLQELYLRKRDYRNAYLHLAEADIYDDSLRNLKVQNNMAEIDFRYRQDTTLLKKNIQIAAVESSALRWKSTFFASVFAFVLMASFILWIVTYRRKAHELRYVRQSSVITGLRMEIIRNRLSPHFMFNALNTVMPNFDKYRELEEHFSLLIRILRDNLQASEHVAIPFSQETGLVRNFLKFNELKDSGRIRTEWNISPEIPPETLIPSMSIQIPVENVIKYAFPPDTDASDALLSISASMDANALHIVIEDNGTGYDPAARHDSEKGTGSGLKMLTGAIDMLNMNNSDKITFAIGNVGNVNGDAPGNVNSDTPARRGTRVTIVIPLNYNYNLIH
jgi:tetratricopeptide (TPR) repeat protein